MQVRDFTVQSPTTPPPPRTCTISFWLEDVPSNANRIQILWRYAHREMPRASDPWTNVTAVRPMPEGKPYTLLVELPGVDVELAVAIETVGGHEGGPLVLGFARMGVPRQA